MEKAFNEHKTKLTEKPVLFTPNYEREFIIQTEQFSIETDHDPLCWLKNNAGNNPRLIGWALILQSYHYTVKHRAGKLIPHVNCLSRIE